MKKACRTDDRLFDGCKLVYGLLLFRLDCLNGANICAGAAVGANVRINDIDITFRNCFDRTFVNTGATCGAVVCDFVSHN